jgi:hypothetical protein
LIVFSAESLAKSPFCKTVNARKNSVCPFKVLFNVPFIGFRIFIVLSAEPLAYHHFLRMLMHKPNE